MSTTKVVIPFADNKAQTLPNLFNILVSFNALLMQDVPDKVSKFRNGQDLSFDIPTESLSDILWHLDDSDFVFKPDSLRQLMPTHQVKRHQYTSYRVLKAPWGIAIDIYGTLEEVDSGNNTIKILEKTLLPEENEQVELGLQTVLSETVNMNKKYIIEIKKIEFNPCHFQIEGLYWASRDWLAKALKVKIAEPQISFDKKTNKYSFSI